MQNKVVDELARTLADQKAVTFTFFDVARPGDRIAVTIRVADEWDAARNAAEGNPACVVGEDFVISFPRKNATSIDTALRFYNRFDAGSAVLEAWRRLAKA